MVSTLPENTEEDSIVVETLSEDTVAVETLPDSVNVCRNLLYLKEESLDSRDLSEAGTSTNTLDLEEAVLYFGDITEGCTSEKDVPWTRMYLGVGCTSKMDVPGRRTLERNVP